MGRPRQVKAEGEWKTRTASPTLTGRRCGPLCHPQRARCQRQNLKSGSGVCGRQPLDAIGLHRERRFGGINSSISNSSSSDDSRTRSDGSNSNDSGDLPALVGRPARDLEVFCELSALQSGRTRSQSPGLTMSASCADALPAYAMRTVEAKRTMEAKRAVEWEAAEIEQAHDSLPGERLEKEREWLEELERRGALLEQREEKQDSDCPLVMAVEQQPELSIPSPIGRKHPEVESPPHTVAGVERSVYRKGWEHAMQSEFEGYMKMRTFSIVDSVPEKRKPVGSKWCFDYKTDKERNITTFKVRLVARKFTQIRNVDYTHSSPPCPPSTSMKLVLAIANE